eukprot:gene8293-117_t
MQNNNERSNKWQQRDYQNNQYNQKNLYTSPYSQINQQEQRNYQQNYPPKQTGPPSYIGGSTGYGNQQSNQYVSQYTNLNPYQIEYNQRNEQQPYNNEYKNPYFVSNVNQNYLPKYIPEDRSYQNSSMVTTRLVKQQSKKRKRSPPPSRKIRNFQNITGLLNSEKKNYFDLDRRYSELKISEDFTKFYSNWVNLTSLETKFLFDTNVAVKCDNENGKFFDLKVDEDSSLFKGVKYNAKVMLYTGSIDESNHFSNNLKFLIGKKQNSGLLSIAGSWNPKLDGDDPTDIETIIKTAKRCTKEFIGVEISNSTNMIKFGEIWYHRPEQEVKEQKIPEMEEKTIIFVVNIAEVIPSTKKDFENEWKERMDTIKKEKENFISLEPEPENEIDEEVPEIPILYVLTQKLKLENEISVSMISLDELLSYTKDDKSENMFEISLFAESFHEMLQMMFGNIILETLKSTKKADQVDERILHAFQYFDRENDGYILAYKLETIIHSLGKDFSRHLVHSLISKVCLENSKKIVYSDLTNKVIFE